MNVKLNGNGFFRVTSDFQAIDSAHSTAHTGIDLAMGTGTKIYSPVDGVVESVVNYGDVNIGKGIMIRTEEGEKLILGHLSDNSSVHVGDHVHVGDYLAKSGNTGHSTGPHLHIGLRDSENRFINPDKFFNGNDTPHQIVKVPETVQPMSPGEFLHNALQDYGSALKNMGLNLIDNIHWDTLFDTLDFIFSVFGF